MLISENRLSDNALLAILALSKDATGIYTGEEIRVQFANDAMLAAWGKDRSVIGKPIEDALPELKGQPFSEILKKVWRTGKTYTGRGTEAKLQVDGRLQSFYFDFEYRALMDAQGITYAILHTSCNVTERRNAEQAVKDKEQQEQQLNEELKAANEGLLSTNEEMAAANEELNTLNAELQVLAEQLEQLNTRLTMSEQRLSSMVNTTPIGMAVLKGRGLVIETANQPVLDIWGRTLVQVQDRHILDVFPELVGQPFPDLLKSVFDTGKPVRFSELAVQVNQPDGSIKELFVDFSYDSLFDLAGHVEAILVSVTDVTPAVMARHKIEEQSTKLKLLNEELAAINEEMHANNDQLALAQESLLASNAKLVQGEANLRLTVEAANLGTWNMELATGKITINPIGLKLYGLQNFEAITLEDVLNIFDPQYLHLANQALSNAIAHNQPTDIQYEIIKPDDGERRWLRSAGATYTNADTGSKWFYGVIMDITGQKQDEQRKNDFIGMVSHELKTPLTSLTGYLQMMQLKVKNSEDGFVIKALEKSSNQVKRMTSLINGFLNLTRLESGKIYLDKQPFNLGQLLQHLIAETIYLQNSHRITCEPCEEIKVNADRDKIGSVISNLLSNAIKYSPDHDDIQVSCIMESGMAKVSVNDQGMGVKPEDQARLFERFYRVSNSKTQTIAGFGIGLYLCAEIVKEHHGKIGVTSIDGEGSTFWFTLPLD